MGITVEDRGKARVSEGGQVVKMRGTEYCRTGRLPSLGQLCAQSSRNEVDSMIFACTSGDRTI
jgi:hypothetical protein